MSASRGDQGSDAADALADGRADPPAAPAAAVTVSPVPFRVEVSPWQPSDWEGLLARPPGLLAASAVGSASAAALGQETAPNGRNAAAALSAGAARPRPSVPDGTRSVPRIGEAERPQPASVPTWADEQVPAAVAGTGLSPAVTDGPAPAVTPAAAAAPAAPAAAPAPAPAPPDQPDIGQVGTGEVATEPVTTAPPPAPTRVPAVAPALAPQAPPELHSWQRAPRPGGRSAAPALGAALIADDQAPAAEPAAWSWPGNPLAGLSAWPVRRLVSTSVAVLLLTVLTAYLVSAVQPTVYGAQADVLFEVTGNSASEEERQLATQEVLLASRGVLAPVADRFDVPLRELTRSQSVEQIAGSSVLRTEVRNEDPELAVRLAQAIADSYVASVSTGVADTSAAQERRLREEITELSVTAAAGRARLEAAAEARARAEAANRDAPVTDEERRLQIEDTALSQRIGALQSQLTQLLLERESASRAKILTSAYLLDEPVGPKPVRAAAAGAMVGLIAVSGFLAFALRRRAFFAPP